MGTGDVRRSGAPKDKLTKPRPGHADLAGMQKYAFDDARDVLERPVRANRGSRRGGALAKALLVHVGISVVSHVVRMVSRCAVHVRPLPEDLGVVDESEVRCFDAATATQMVAEIKAAAKEGDSLGGIVEVIAYGVPVGLAATCTGPQIDGLLAGALMSIQAVRRWRSVTYGPGLPTGSVAHDAIAVDESFNQGWLHPTK